MRAHLWGSASIFGLALVIGAGCPALAQTATASPPPAESGGATANAQPSPGAPDGAPDQTTAPSPPGAAGVSANPSTASAVTGASSASPNTYSNAVNEVVVTAERRAEPLSKVGIPVQAVTADQLRTLQFKSTADLSHVVPSFQATASGATGAPIYSLRGVGFNTQNIGSTSPIGLYIDEVAYPYPYMTLGESFDLERVEVLDGPQGTLYGRNTTGGLINYIAAKPTAKPQASLTAGAGNYGSSEFSGFVSGPITDTLKGRLSFDSENRDDDWQHSITRDDGLGKYHQISTRGILDWHPVSKFETVLTGSYWHKTGDTQAGQAIGFIVPGQSAAAEASVQTHPRSDTAADFVPQSDQPQSAQTGIIRPPDHINSDFASGVLRASYRFNDNLSLVSLSSYSYLNAYECNDFAGVQTEQVVQCTHATIGSVSQEGRLIGEYGPVRFTLGGYYSNDRVNEVVRGYAGELSTITGLRGLADSVSDGTYTPEQIDTSYRLFGQYGYTDDNVKAGFANVDYKINQQFKLTLGGRYTEDNINFTGAGQDQDGNNVALINTVFPILTGNPNLGKVVPNGSYSLNAAVTGFAQAVEVQDQNNFAWRVNLDYTPTSNLLFYALVTRGFKSGLFPTLAASTVNQLTPVDQEQLTDYEGGAKLQLFEHRVQLNSSFFYYEYKNRQVYGQTADLIFGTLPRVVNIPKSEMYGLNSDLTWRVTPHLTSRTGFSVLETKIDNYTGYNEYGITEDFKGQPLPLAPKYQVFTSLVDDIPLTENLGLEASGDGSFQSTSYSFIGALQQFRIAPYYLFGGALTLHDADRRWLLSIYGRNIFNTYYWTSAQVSHDSVVRFAGMPATYGVRLTYNYF